MPLPLRLAMSRGLELFGSIPDYTIWHNSRYKYVYRSLTRGNKKPVTDILIIDCPSPSLPPKNICITRSYGLASLSAPAAPAIDVVWLRGSWGGS